PGSTNLHYEGEMVIVIGDRAKNISAAEADDYIFGISVGNDVTERGYPSGPFDLLRAKGGDTMAPLGPWIVPGLSYDRLGLVTRLNGKVVQKSSTRRMIFSVAEIVSILSRYMTLEPGDVIYTGTPGKTRAMKPGDKIEISLEGVGVLRNTVGKRQ
ncbi:MAG TPA: FAA hydrolase family protein, partial [Rhizobiales bacterium]|nr:FAA hydrolase family protein [Hyphomicrobiales bacterium]